ncbi:MAG TPA: class II aldolase/adducin family protein [Rectinemataceae bacterium]|nr:class II aldolase/adducin family protein [Rectinemataceae bacterium]
MGKLDILVEISQRYGADPDWVLAGGGNTSFKDADTLYVKASGFPLGQIGVDGFCAMDRKALDAIWTRAYPAEREAREAAVLQDLLAARQSGEHRRPSVETLMHGFFPQAYVVHTHPAIVNGLTCGRDGEKAFRRLFADEAIWVPFVDPGYVLAREVRSRVEAFRASAGAMPAIMLMQNHGLLVAGETRAEIEERSASVVSRIASELPRSPDFSARAVDPQRVTEIASRISSLAPPDRALCFRRDAELLRFAASDQAFAPLAEAFSPDHIVYAGHEFLRLDSPEGLEAGWRLFSERNGVPPRIVLVRDLGVFSCATGQQAAERAMDLFVDACKIAVYSESFGGARHMTKDQIDFIRNWEVERYRSRVTAES